MKDMKIPTWLIVAAFIFSPPVAIVLTILKVVFSSGSTDDSKGNTTNNGTNVNKNAPGVTHTVYHSSNGTNGTTVKTTYNTTGSSGVKTGYKTPGGTDASDNMSQKDDGTYHYSYVKTPDISDKKTESIQNAASATSRTGLSGSYTSRPAGTYNAVPQKKYKTCGATVIASIFTVISLIISLALMIDTVDYAVTFGIRDPYIVHSFISTMISSSVTVILYLLRQFYKSRDYRIITYLAVLRGEKFMSLSKLAKTVDVSTSRVIKDLHFMQSKGLLGNDVVIDKRIQYLILSKDGSAAAEAEYERLSSMSREDAKKERETIPEKQKQDIAPDLTEHERILARIRELNDDIDDVGVSEKIDQIEELTRKIFRLVDEHPEMESKLESFLNYYLPTTLKLLNSYAYFEEQGIHGENIDSGMKNIEETLDLLINGYKTQLDKLFESETFDVSTEAKVLEQMMKSEGITENNDFKPDENGFGDVITLGGEAFAVSPDEEDK